MHPGRGPKEADMARRRKRKTCDSCRGPLNGGGFMWGMCLVTICVSCFERLTGTNIKIAVVKPEDIERKFRGSDALLVGEHPRPPSGVWKP